MVLIGIAGGTGSGKTTMVKRVMRQVPEGKVILVPQDAYYKDNSHIPVEKRVDINFDHPDSVDFDLLVRQLQQLKAGKAVAQPVYSYITCTRSSETLILLPADVIILEGILILTNQELRDMIDIRVYLDSSPEDRLERIIKRDREERGRTAEQILERYEMTVKPMHMEFVEPSKHYADIVLLHGGENKEAIDKLCSIIMEKISV
jgi:uridine kinase